MTTKRDQGAELDDLLRKSLPDDLPADVRAGMRERIDRFRAATLKEEAKTAPWAGFFRKSAWAALSILMLVTGSLLQGLGARNPLADGISLIETRQAVEGRLAAAESMSCLARVRNETGEFTNITIFWRPGEASKVRASASDGSLLENSKIGSPRESAGPWARAAALFSNPGAVRNLLAGDWRPVKLSGEAGRSAGIFTIPAGAGADWLEFTIDLDTFLPVRIARLSGSPAASEGMANIVWEARFTF